MHPQPLLLKTIRGAWGWTGVDPVAVTATNAFGNVIVRSADGSFWRICPEELWCRVIATNPADMDVLRADAAFQRDWQMKPIVEKAAATLGLLGDERCYCLKIPAVLGGKYVPDNFGTISRDEVIGFSGYLALKIKDVPDGSQVRFTFDGLD